MSDATERLRDTVERVRRTPLGARIPANWSSLAELPFTVKDDLREHYPLGLVTVPREQLRRIHASSGSRGRPTVVAYTEHDLDVWSQVMAYCMEMAGVRPGMVVHNAYGYGLFTGGPGVPHGAPGAGGAARPAEGGGGGGPGAALGAPPGRGGLSAPPPPPPHRPRL